MKKVAKSRTPLRRAIHVADDGCPSCGTKMIEKRGALRLPVNGEEISVPSALHLSCPKCGEVVLRFQDAKRLHEDAIAIYRKKHRLLSADEIRRLIKGERIVRDTGPSTSAPEEQRPPGRRSSVPPSGRQTGLEPEPQPGG